MTTATSIKIDDELKARIKELAAARRRSSHWIMREAHRPICRA
jgi:predicted transcriptional regulator